jgi:hypothetical protein
VFDETATKIDISSNTVWGLWVLPNDIKQPKDTEEDEDEARQGKARQEKIRHNETRHHMTKQYRTRHDKMKQTGLETSKNEHLKSTLKMFIQNVHFK